MECHPVSARDQSRLQHFGKKVLFGIVLGYALIAVWNLERRYFGRRHFKNRKIWTHRKFIFEEIKAKEVLTQQRSEYLYFPSSRWYSWIVSKRPRIPRTLSKAGTTCRCAKISVENLKANRKGFNRQKQKMTLKPGKTSGRSKVTSSVVITVNVEFNSVCRMKKHSLWNTLMSPGLLTQIWMCCKKNEKMIIGMCTRIEVYQVLGQDSRSSHYWVRNLQQDICGLERYWQQMKQLQTWKCGLQHGPKLEKPLNREKNKSGQSRSQNSIRKKKKKKLQECEEKVASSNWRR